MVLGLSVIGVIALVWAITASVARPRGDAAAERALERRQTQLAGRPELATQLDVEWQLRHHPLPEATVARVMGLAAERRVPWSVVWRWSDRFGAERLILALDADVAVQRLIRHLESGTAPDWQAMELFAGLNGGVPAMPLAEVLDPDDAATLDALEFDVDGWETHAAPGTEVPEVDLSQFSHLPPIFDPGLPVTRSTTPPADAPERGQDGDEPGTGGWPRVA